MFVKPIRIGILGVGKIARDQHIPAITANPAFTFAAAASRHAHTGGVPNFHSMAEMLQGVPDLDAVAICTPPQVHYEAAKLALARSKHVLLEKPPCTSTAQLDHLVHLAKAGGRTLYQPWHSRHAQGVAARRLLSAGGGQLTVGDKPVPRDPGALAGEYAAIYSRFSVAAFDP